MVSMDMGDKYSRKLGKTDTGTPQLHLRSLTAIYHKLLSPQLHHL
jgi:hypothetical protein